MGERCTETVSEREGEREKEREDERVCKRHTVTRETVVKLGERREKKDF